MTEEDLTVPALTMVLFINPQQVDPTSRYHSFKFVLVNYIFNGKVTSDLSC